MNHVLGRYTAAEVEGQQRSDGFRWHQGIITDKLSRDGKTLFSGHHTMGNEDGKWCSYRGYSEGISDILQNLKVFHNCFAL